LLRSDPGRGRHRGGRLALHHGRHRAAGHRAVLQPAVEVLDHLPDRAPRLPLPGPGSRAGRHDDHAPPTRAAVTARRRRTRSMTITDFAAHLVLATILMIGGYQFYFWCQRNPLRPVREFRLAVDERIPYWPGWVWIYSLLYYPGILYVNWVVDSSREFVYL